MTKDKTVNMTSGTIEMEDGIHGFVMLGPAQGPVTEAVLDNWAEIAVTVIAEYQKKEGLRTTQAVVN